MRLKDLTKYNIPDSILESWRRRQGDYLLPLQIRAIKSGLLDMTESGNQPNNLLISAPTSSGKSFCGEMAAVASLLKRKKAVMLLPLKSIAEEKYNYFRDCYADIGLRTIIVTGDHPQNNDDFELGNFDLALAIYEKFNRLLTTNPDILQQIGLVVIDELQMIGEPGRGMELEMALTKLMVSGYNPRLIALSAVMGENSGLADWLGCRMVKETVRPVDLLMGVATDGWFNYRSFNSGLEGREKIALHDGGDNRVDSLIEFLKSDNSQKLVFLKSRRDTINAALALAAVVDWSGVDDDPTRAGSTAALLDGEEDSFLIRTLKQTLSRGVAFHNSDLIPSQRQVVEQAYRRGQVKVIFSTTTLAMGVNLPAETVLLETMKYSPGSFGGRPSLIPISVSDFQNIAGRAGRFGINSEGAPGKAIIRAGSRFEYDVLWSGYIEAESDEQPGSTLEDSDLEDAALELIVSGFGGSYEAIKSNLSALFYYQSKNLLDDTKLKKVCDLLVSSGLVDKNLQPTGPGIAAAECGISTGTCRHFLKLLGERYPESEIGWLFVALTADEFDSSRCSLTSSEYHNRIYQKLLHEQFREHINSFNAYGDLKLDGGPLDFRMMTILKSLFVLTEWADGRAIDQLEQKYQLHHGQIIGLAETAAWLLSSIGRLIYALNADSELPALIDNYVFKVQFGIEPEMREVHYLLGDILSRPDYQKLRAEGLQTIESLRTFDEKKLAGIIRPRDKLEKLLNEIKNLDKEAKMRKDSRSQAVNIYQNRGEIAGSGGFEACPSSVEIDGHYEKERYLVKIDGFPVRLTGKSFMYLAKLAFARLSGSEGWIYKDDIEAGFNQARYLYRLRQEFKAAGCSWPIFENNRLGYYRLDLEPEKIRLNLDNFKEHYDFELRRMADELAPRLTG